MTTAAQKTNLPAGVIAAVVGALAAGVAWTLVGNAVNGAQIGFGAIAVGALVGFLAGKAGGQDSRLPIIAGAFGALACFIGDVFIEAHGGAEQLHVSSFTIVTDYTSQLWAGFKYDFSPMSLLFYGLAAVFGFRVATQTGARLAAGPGPTFPAPQTWEPPAPGSTPITPGTTEPSATDAPAATAPADEHPH